MSGRLDPWRDPAEEVRVQVSRWEVLGALEDQYIAPARRLRLVWDYLWRVGPVAVARKIVSRSRERERNVKVHALGTGTVLEAPEGSGLERGVAVAFYAPNHPAAPARVVVDRGFVEPLEALDDAAEGADAGDTRDDADAFLRRFAGWSRYSGATGPAGDAAEGRRALLNRLRLVETPAASGAVEVRERREIRVSTERPTAAVFGLGNYAKTQVLPRIREHLTLAAVHEVDPDQLGPVDRWDVTVDTAPGPRPDETFDAWFIAGFHHTHGPLAVDALTRGGYAVVEKPLVTTREQLVMLRGALQSGSGRGFWSAFQKRYSRLHSWAMEDLGQPDGAPIDMHSIVYEIPLPARHWYNWPSSGSRLISNGCHWLDYFIFVNDFSPAVRADVRGLRGADVQASAELKNGARMTLTLTDTGSARLGVREVVELRAEDATVRILDAARYESERTARRLRRRRVNPMSAYQRMYTAICRGVVEGRTGDPIESLRSTELMLELDERLTGASSSPASR